MGKTIKVGMADLNLCMPPDMITTLGLGSCVGIVLYDVRTKISGMVHVMLPDSTKINNNSNKAKFADTGITELMRQMQSKGAQKGSIIAKIAGGAQMFAFSANNDMLRVGQRNVEATREQLAKMNIRIVAADVGDSYGRTIEFYPETGALLIKSVGKQIRTL